MEHRRGLAFSVGWTTVMAIATTIMLWGMSQLATDHAENNRLRAVVSGAIADSVRERSDLSRRASILEERVRDLESEVAELRALMRTVEEHHRREFEPHVEHEPSNGGS